MFPIGNLPAYGTVRVIWREESWRCELAVVPAGSVLRLYDGQKLELEHEILPGTIRETAEVMHRSVLQFLSRERIHASRTKAMRPGRGALSLCTHCRSLRAYLWAKRPGR
jgi:hypothetical protein